MYQLSSTVVGAAPVCEFHHSDPDGNDKPVSSSLSQFSQDCGCKIFNKSKSKQKITHNVEEYICLILLFFRLCIILDLPVVIMLSSAWAKGNGTPPARENRDLHKINIFHGRYQHVI